MDMKPTRIPIEKGEIVMEAEDKPFG